MTTQTERDRPQQSTDEQPQRDPHLDTALEPQDTVEFEDEIELYKTYGGD